MAFGFQIETHKYFHQQISNMTWRYHTVIARVLMNLRQSVCSLDFYSKMLCQINFKLNMEVDNHHGCFLPVNKLFLILLDMSKVAIHM